MTENMKGKDVSKSKSLVNIIFNQTNNMTGGEIMMVTNLYIGVHGGYLGTFTYKTHEEFYPIYCNLDIVPSAYDGTTRERFINILKDCNEADQAKILKGVLEKFPVEDFPEDQREKKHRVAEKIRDIIRRLENRGAVAAENLAITNDVVERAISDAKVLIEKNGATSGVDRVHTALHGYLKNICKEGGIAVDEMDTLTQVFKKLKAHHPALQNTGARQGEIDQIITSFSNVLDKLNPLRNKASLSHPNEALLEEDEAVLVINTAHTILNYLNRKFK